jgi:LuxR family maltose regulon positive regulatory protein
MLDNDGSHDVLRQLERINVFVVALDDEHCWYRFHHLLGELLNDQFERVGAPERNRCCAEPRCGTWTTGQSTRPCTMPNAAATSHWRDRSRSATGHG